MKRSSRLRVLGGACVVLGVVVGYGVSRGVFAAGPAAPVGSATEPSGAQPISLTPTIMRPASPDLLARGKRLYEQQCAACHGLAGTGDGEAAYLLYPKPRDFTAGRFALSSTWERVPTGPLHCQGRRTPAGPGPATGRSEVA